MINAVGRIAGRFLGSLVAIGVLLVVGASPVGADGVGPTNYRSVIDSVSPDHDGVRVEVIGEDSFLQVSVQPGITVAIPGYDGDPYLRITRDGSVERNRASSATYLNQNRSGRVDLPAGIGTSAEEDWEEIGSDGTVAWHDHRIHYMGSGTPAVGPGGLVQEWEVPLVVNDREVTISGSLYRDGNVIPWPAAVIAVSAIGVVVAIRRHGQRWAMTAVVAAASVALAVSASVAWLNPPGSGASWLPIVLPVAAIFAGLATRLVPANRQPLLRLAPLLAATACLLGWAVPMVGVLWMPNIPSVLSAPLVRAGVGLALGAVIGAAASVLVWPDAPANANSGVDAKADQNPAN